MKIKTILVSQPKPSSEKSPYFDLADRLKLKIDFRPFIHVEGIPVKEFRQERIDLADYSAIIFTSRNAVDHYFRIAEESKFTVPDTMKYFCTSESTALYLQKYIVYRKRKIFHGKQTLRELMDIIKKHDDEDFLFPCSDLVKPSAIKLLDDSGIDYKKAVLYRTVESDLSDLADIKYDILVFFSPSGISSLYKNFPDFEQGDTTIAIFGPTTLKAAEDRGLRIDVAAPMQAPSMTMAIEKFIKNK